jgi:hypothetical protein
MKKLALFCLFISAPLFADEESDALPERYFKSGLKSVAHVDDFEYTRWSYGDNQSLIVRTKQKSSFLLVFSAPIERKTLELDLKLDGRRLEAGVTDACLVSERVNYSVDMGAPATRGVRNCRFRVIAAYAIENREQERKVIKFLRAND